MASDSLENLVHACHRLAAKGYGPSTSGNLSLRQGDRIYLTATRAALDEVQVERLACLDEQGQSLNAIAPTKEQGFHLAIYRKRPDVNAVVHLHPTHAVAASTLLPAGPSCTLPVVTPQVVMKAGRVPVLPYFPPGTQALAQAVGEACAGSAVLLQNHGVITFSKNLRDALGALEELEENCRQWLLVRGEGRLLTDQEIAQLLELYGDRY